MNFEEMINLCPDPVIGLNREGLINLFNESAEQVLGYTAAEVVNKINIVDIYPDRTCARDIKRLLYDGHHGGIGKLRDFETTLIGVGGQQVPVRLSAALIFKNGQEVGSIGFFHDLSERKRLEAELRVLSITDGLSGLYNHRHFCTEMSREVERTRRSGREFALLCIDLDSFKQVNDNLGHSVGDRLICQVAAILSQTLRSGDSAYRYGGDEFMVILPDTPITAAMLVTERIRINFNQAIAEYDDILSGASGTMRVTMSIGVTVNAINEKVANIINRADFAMYESKNAGGDRMTVFDVPLDKFSGSHFKPEQIISNVN